MEKGRFHRLAILVGDEAVQRLSAARVLVFGTGGVGSWCVEGLVRSGIGHVTIVDPDVVALSNLNRQLMALDSTLGRPKVEVLRERMLDINPGVSVNAVRKRFSAETAEEFDLDSFDFVVDAIDSLKDKAELILRASASKAVFISSMGAALKMDPSKVRVAEFWQVRGCPLGAALRKRFRQRKTFPVKDFRCVYDEEVLPMKVEQDACDRVNGSAVPVTAIFGFTIAGLILGDIAR